MPPAGGEGGAVSSVNGLTGAVTITAASLSLGSVNNTSDLAKPISTATQTALDLKANNADVAVGSAIAITGLENKIAKRDAMGVLWCFGIGCGDADDIATFSGLGIAFGRTTAPNAGAQGVLLSPAWNSPINNFTWRMPLRNGTVLVGGDTEGKLLISEYPEIGGALADTDLIAIDRAGVCRSALSRLWTWIQVKFDTVMTIAGAKTFSAQMELTSQLPTSDASAMNRGMLTKELMFIQGLYRTAYTAVGYSTSGTGTAAVSDNGSFNLVGSLTASAYQRAAIARNITTVPSWTGSNSNCAIPTAFALSHFFQTGTSANIELRFVVGEVGGGAPIALGSNRLAARGWGFVIYYSVANTRREILLFAHDGTTYVESAAVALIGSSEPSGWLHNTILTSDGAGNIKLFDGVNTNTSEGGKRTDNTALLTLAGGPTSGNYGQPYASALIVNGATPPTVAASWRIQQCSWHTGTIY